MTNGCIGVQMCEYQQTYNAIAAWRWHVRFSWHRQHAHVVSFHAELHEV